MYSGFYDKNQHSHPHIRTRNTKFFLAFTKVFFDSFAFIFSCCCWFSFSGGKEKKKKNIICMCAHRVAICLQRKHVTLFLETNRILNISFTSLILSLAPTHSTRSLARSACGYASFLSTLFCLLSSFECVSSKRFSLDKKNPQKTFLTHAHFFLRCEREDCEIQTICMSSILSDSFCFHSFNGIIMNFNSVPLSLALPIPLLHYIFFASSFAQQPSEIVQPKNFSTSIANHTTY